MQSTRVRRSLQGEYIVYKLACGNYILPLRSLQSRPLARYKQKKRSHKASLWYSEPGSNRYGHYCPQDFKSGVSTYSTIRATQSPKRRVQMYDFIFILPNILPRTWELYLTPITNAEIKHHPKSVRPFNCQKSRDMVHRKRIHPGIVQLVQPRVEWFGMCHRLRLITTKLYSY